MNLEISVLRSDGQRSYFESTTMRRSAVVGSIVIVAVATWLYWMASTTERRNADRIIEAIEQYRKTHHRLPNPGDHALMSSLGFELREGWHPDYEVGQKGRYRITIVEGFDGPYWTYDSNSRMWRKDSPIAGDLDKQKR